MERHVGTSPFGDLPRGTRILGVTPPMFEGRDLAHRFVAHSIDAGGVGVIVSTDRSATTVLEGVGRHLDGTDWTGRLGIVDATGQGSPDRVGDCHVRTVASPADLTGIGVAFADLRGALADVDARSVHVAIDSVSSLFVYSEFERVYRFVHAMNGQVDALGAVGLALVRADVDGGRVDRLAGAFDGLLELRDADRGTEYRIRGIGGGGEWRPYRHSGRGDREPGVPSRSRGNDPGESPASAEATVESPPASLREQIATVTARDLELVVCNYTGPDDALDGVRDHLGRLGVEVRTASMSTDAPRDVAILHRGPDPLAMSPVGTLRDAVALDEELPEGDEVARPDVLVDANRRKYSVENGGKLEMLRISRLIEGRALEAGTGTLRAGFQRLDRLVDERGTRELYERIARAGVDVHLYGAPGEVPNEDLYVTHPGDEPELDRSWFVVFDGDGDPDRMATLVSEEAEPGVYDGFWTYRPGIVRSTDAYLRAKYPA